MLINRAKTLNNLTLDKGYFCDFFKILLQFDAWCNFCFDCIVSSSHVLQYFLDYWGYSAEKHFLGQTLDPTRQEFLNAPLRNSAWYKRRKLTFFTSSSAVQFRGPVLQFQFVFLLHRKSSTSSTFLIFLFQVIHKVKTNPTAS